MILKAYPLRLKLLIATSYLTLSHYVVGILLWVISLHLKPGELSGATLFVGVLTSFTLTFFVFYGVLKIKLPTNWILTRERSWNCSLFGTRLIMGYFALTLAFIGILSLDGMIIISLLGSFSNSR